MFSEDRKMNRKSAKDLQINRVELREFNSQGRLEIALPVVHGWQMTVNHMMEE